MSVVYEFKAPIPELLPVDMPPPVDLNNGFADTRAFLKQIDESTERRCKHLLDVERGGELAIKLELSICAEDPLYWLHWYGYTYDPRNPLEQPPIPATLPFDLCERQKELWRWFEYVMSARQDGCVKKSRGIGFTWEVGALAWHKWRFVPGFKTTFGSRKATEVDQIGNPDSIFEKIRMLYRWLPHWMLPKGFNPFEHDKQMLLINPENDNAIRGEGGEEMGRGGRSTLYIIDEASRIEHADRVDAATSANADVRIWGSSINPQNENNLFARKYNSMPPERVFRFHYSEHPINTPARMARKKMDVSEEIWAAEYEIDDSYTVEDITIPASWVNSAVKLKGLLDAKVAELLKPTASGVLSSEAQLLARALRLEPLISGVAGGDVGGGKAQSVVIGRFGAVVTRPKAWGNPDTTDTALKMLDYCADELRLPLREDRYEPKIKVLRYDSVAIGQGVSSTMRRNPRPGLIVTGVNSGGTASEIKWPDGEYAHEKFSNIKAEGWWTARERFKKTHQMVLWLTNPSLEGAKQYPVDELISIPDDPLDQHLQRLTAQLSQPKWHRRENGKILIESKESLAKRGIASPDYADALILTLCGQSKAEKWVEFAKVRV